MIKNKLFLLMLLFVLSSYSLFAQKPDLNNYLILTVEDSFSKGFEGVKDYYWIIEVDSLKSTSSQFSPLLIAGFSKTLFENCCKGVDVDPFAVSKSDSIFDLGNEYFKGSEYLQNLILLKRKKIQLIVKEWYFTKNKELINFYITPIKGRFCFSGLTKAGLRRAGFNTKVVIPYSSFELNLEFWNSSKFSILSNQDFSSLKFNMLR